MWMPMPEGDPGSLRRDAKSRRPGAARLACCAVLAAALSACGGGSDAGGGSGTGVGTGIGNPITVFPLQAAYKSFFINGYTQAFTISGSCSGSVVLRSARAVSASFEGFSGYDSVVVNDFNAPSCGLTGTGAATHQYVDAEHRLLGFSVDANGGYGVYETPVTLPVFVRVGETGALGRQQLYTDSSRTVPTGTRQLSYAIVGETNSTAVVQFIAQNYDMLGRLLSTQTTAYRLGSNEAFPVVYDEIRFEAQGNTAERQLRLTPQ